MKRVLLLLFVAFLGLQFVNAQEQEIGLRFGDVTGGNVGIDGVFGLKQFSRVHATVSFGGTGVGIDALWDFLYRPIDGEAFNWYVGAGPYAFLGDPFALGVMGEAGLEYRFNQVPLVLGVDWRPALRIIDNTSMLWGGFGLNVRWVFNQSK